MSDEADRLVEDYLDRLEAELADVPAARRRELVEEISEHIAQARSDLSADSEAELRTLLSRLGEPADIAGAAREPIERLAADQHRPERLTLVLLAVGGLVLPLVGWLIGVVLLWASSAWSTRDKLIGTLLPPGGLAAAVVAGAALLFGSNTAQRCADAGNCGAGGSTTATAIITAAGLAILIVTPLATTAYLARRRGLPRAAARPADA